jgi:HD-like signal output (HDOD) protein/ActR/RegA family two-component response regulator
MLDVTRDAKAPVILFVDDEENILNGIKRLLRSKRNEWSMEFSTSAADALDLLDHIHADVVVSDMRMPHMDGAEFLAKVQERFPGTVRIVLSGFADREAILRTIGPSHRYLAKPCPEEVLVGAIESSLGLRAVLASEHIMSGIAGLTHLPTLPRIYGEILNELASEYASAESLAEKVERDVAIAAQILKLTNSAYFGLPREVSTVKQAVQFLGFDNVRAVVLLAGVFEQFKNVGGDMAKIAEVLSHRSLAIGILAQSIARAEKFSARDVDDAFSAGLLMHIGTLVLIASSSRLFREAMVELDNGGHSIEEVERKHFGGSHAELGGYLLNLWGFNDQIVEAVTFHHVPSAKNAFQNNVLTAVHAAQYFLRAKENETSGLGAREPLDLVYLERVGSVTRVPAWRDLSVALLKGWSNG